MNSKTSYILGLLVFLFMTGCGNKPESGDDVQQGDGGLIMITTEQFLSDSMLIGGLKNQSFEELLSCNGYVTAAPGGIALISAPIAGVVESVRCNLGESVGKGQTILTVSGNELILVQKEFAETAARYHRLAADYKRSQALFSDKVGSEKELMAIESEYKSAKAVYFSLKRRLEMLRLDPAKVEAGDIYAAYPVTAAIQGNVTRLSAVIGQYAEPQAILAEIVDISKLQLRLSVFEKDINSLKAGQRVLFHMPGDNNIPMEATLRSVGQAIEAESRSIPCIASINTVAGGRFVNSQFVEASIITNTREAAALPDEAILKAGKENYVLVVEKSDNKSYALKKVIVKTGISSGGNTEIIEGKGLEKVIVRGGYNISSE